MSKPWLTVSIYDRARNEIQFWPKGVKKDFGSILTKLQKGESVGYPDTKAIGDVAPGAVEVRIKDASGIYRVFYTIETDKGILVFHAFKKKTRKTPKHEFETAKVRLKAFLRELEE